MIAPTTDPGDCRVTNNPRQYVQNHVLYEILDSYILDDGTEEIYERRIVSLHEQQLRKEPANVREQVHIQE